MIRNTLPLLLCCCLLAACVGSDESGSGEPITMITPYVQESDIDCINEAYSESSSCPWGFEHNGVDFFPVTNFVWFQAPAAAEVREVKLWQNPGNNYWQVNVDLKCNDRYSISMGFEPMSGDQADGQIQLTNIVVTVGQQLTQSQPVGRLYLKGGGTHVHFGLYSNDTAVCPESFFTSNARASIMTILHKTWPTDTAMCYQ